MFDGVALGALRLRFACRPAVDGGVGHVEPGGQFLLAEVEAGAELPDGCGSLLRIHDIGCYSNHGVCQRVYPRRHSNPDHRRPCRPNAVLITSALPATCSPRRARVKAVSTRSRERTDRTIIV